MSDNLSVFGITYNGVNGFKAKDTNNNIITYTKAFTQADEGKVVSNGALVSQTSQNIDTNGTYDTTLKNEVVVNVSGGGGYTIDQIIERDIGGAVSYSGDVTDFPIGALSSSKITSFSSDKIITNSGGFAFANCSQLESVSLPNLSMTSTNQGARMFINCTSLLKLYLPEYKRSGDYFAQGCSSLKSIVLPLIDYQLGQYFANGCTALESVDLGENSSTFGQGNCFSSSGLSILVLRRTAGVMTLGNINNFNNSPFASTGSGGTLYVPNALISSYQSASNWSTILGYTNNQIKSIESTHTDPTAPIDLTLYYADGTTIPT